MVDPGARYCSSSSRPVPSMALTACTGAPIARSATSAIILSASAERSTLVSTTTGDAPLSQTTVRYLSTLAGFRSASTGETIQTVSTFAATICSSVRFPGALREKTDLRGRTLWTSASPRPSPQSSTTQSPTAGNSAEPDATWRSLPAILAAISSEPV